MDQLHADLPLKYLALFSQVSFKVKVFDNLRNLRENEFVIPTLAVF